jgi:hypothetical protein
MQYYTDIPKSQEPKQKKDNLCVKIFRFFFPKGGFKANLKKGKEIGKGIGEQAGTDVMDKLNKNKSKK